MNTKINPIFHPHQNPSTFLMLIRIYKIQNQFITHLPPMQQREEVDFLDKMSNEEISHFLRICAFGDMETDGSQLSTQEQQHLFDLLDRLHKSSGVDVKGIWPILSLSFKNRSGLVLMTMLYNSKVEFSELLYKKSFLKDIQTLQNRNFTKKNLYRIIQITGIEKQIFQQKFNKQMLNFAKIQQEEFHRPPQLCLSSNRILDQNQFDSDPEYQFYQQIKQLQNNEAIFRNFSMVLNRNIFEDGSVSENEEQFEETISIPMKRRGDRQQRKKKKNKTKKKKAKRPNQKNKKQRMMQQIKKQDIEAINFVSARKEKRRLKQAHKLLYMKIDENPTTAKKPQRNSHLNSPYNKISSDQSQNSFHDNEPQSPVARRKKMKNSNARPRRAQKRMMNMERESQSKQYLIIQNDLQESVIIEEEQKEQSVSYKRLSKNIEYMDENPQQEIQKYTIFNESIQNLEVKYIDFSVNAIMGDQQMQEQLEFNSQEYINFIDASTNTQKQLQKFIKQIVKQKNQIQFQSIEKLVRIIKFDILQKCWQSHIKPILQYKLIKILAKIIGDIVSILYTSSNNPLNMHHQSCKSLIEIYKKSNMQQSEFQSYIEEAIKTICEDFQEIKKPTNSKVQLTRPVQIIQQALKIRLRKEDFQKTVLVSLLIFQEVFLVNLFGHSFMNKSQDTPLQRLLKNTVRMNPKFVIYISQIYQLYKVQVTSKEQLYAILSLAKQIDLKNNEHEIIILLSNFISEVIYSFIQFRLKNNPNYKPVLSFVVRNQYLDSCEKIGEVGYEITLKKYETFMKFSAFHEDLTITKFLEFINKVDFTKNHEESLFLGILDLLIKCYQITVMTNQYGSGGVSNWQKLEENRKTIKGNLQKIIKIFCDKYERYEQLETFPNQQSEINLKKSKFSKVISVFYEKFIDSQKLSQNPEHYRYSMHIIFTFIWPMLSKSSKEDSFTVTLTETLLKKIYDIEVICANFEIQGQRKAAETQTMDQEQQMDFLFQLKQETTKKIMIFLNEIGNMLKDINLGQKISKQFLSFLQMKSSRQNVCYEVHGVMTALSFFNKQGLSSLKLGVFKNLGEHAKQIKLERNSRPFKTTNKFVLEYLKGFFKTIKIFSHGNIMKIFQDLGKETRENILDILLISLVCEKDTKIVIQLIQMACKIPGFKMNEHILNYFPIHKHGAFRGKSKTDLEYYLSVVSQNKAGVNNAMMYRLIEKFNSPIFNVVNKLYKQYEEVQWKQMQAYVGLNLLNIFVFLFNVSASENIIKMYRPSFIIHDISLMNSKNNILLGLQLEELSPFSSQHKLVQLFRTIYENNKSNLSKTMNQFFKYISNEQIKPQKFRNDRQKFIKIKLLIEAIHNQKIDKTSFEICIILLSNFLAQVFLREEVHDSALDFFFNLFKKYPNLNAAYMQILKINCQKIDRIIKSSKNYNMMKCSNIEQAIKKYIINQYCLFEELYQILEKKAENILKLDRLDEQFELNSVIEKCMRFLEKFNRQSDQEIMGKYRDLYQRLSQKRDVLRLGNFNGIQHQSLY